MRFQEDPNGTLSPGDVEVVSEFAQAPAAGYGAGSKTHRISTTRRLGQMTSQREDQPATAAGEMPSGARERFGDRALRHAASSTRTTAAPRPSWMTKDEIVIGRQAPDVWVDLWLDTSLDVSREHARLQRTPEGAFRIKDLTSWARRSTAPPAAQPGGGGGEVKDLDRWVDLPDQARIGLAGVIHLHFERIGG